MKSFYTLPLMTAALLISLTSVQAKNHLLSENTAPGLPTTSDGCFDELDAISDQHVSFEEHSSADPHLERLCYALDRCEKKESQNTMQWSACVEKAQGKYEKATNPLMRENGETYQGQLLRVNTVESGANYNFKGPDHKGFENSWQ